MSKITHVPVAFCGIAKSINVHYFTGLTKAILVEFTDILDRLVMIIFTSNINIRSVRDVIQHFGFSNSVFLKFAFY